MSNQQDAPVEASEAEKALQTELAEMTKAWEAAETAKSEVETALAEAIAAKTVAEEAQTVAEADRDEAVKRAKAAEKAAGLADPEKRTAKIKADYEKGKNYAQLAEKYNIPVSEVDAIVTAE